MNWINSDLQLYMDGEANSKTKAWIEKYFAFKARIRRVFGPANEESMAESIIQRLKQTKSAAEYSTTFQHYAAKTSWNNDAQMSIFKRGLKDNVQDELMRYGGTIEDIEDLMKTAIELDDKLHQRSIEKNEGRGRFTGRAIWGYGNRGHRDSWGQKQGDPMKLDVLKP